MSQKYHYVVEIFNDFAREDDHDIATSFHLVFADGSCVQSIDLYSTGIVK